MNIKDGAFFVFATAQALPAFWGWFVSLTMTKAQMVRKYCPPVTEIPAGLTDFQKEQYRAQCAKLGVYIFQAAPAKPLVKPAPVPVEFIGPPEPEVQP